MINDWELEKFEELESDLMEGRKPVPDVTIGQERVAKEAGQMRWDLEANCVTRANKLRQSGSNSDKEERSSSGCGNCLSMRRLNEEYEANSFATQQKYRGTRHNFEGTVESIDQEPSVPPKPLIRARSGKVRITFRFGWDEDYSWVLALSKGDWVKVNCQIRSADKPWASSDAVIPSLDECTKAD